jgi:hypothetical protein
MSGSTGGTPRPAAPGAPVPPAPSRETPSGEGTVIRSATPVPEARPTPPPAERGALAPPPTPRTGVSTGAGADDAPARGRGRRGLVAAAVALLLVLVGGVATAMVVGGGDDDEPAAGPTPTTSASTSSSSPAVAGDPRVSARPGYRAVTFTLAAPQGAPADTALEVDSGAGWRDVDPGRLTVPTDRGGERACVEVRVAGSAGDGVRRCGRAAPPRVSLVREQRPCSRTIEGTTYPCTYYAVRVEGLTPGSSPLAEVLPTTGLPWCRDPQIGDQFCREVRVGDDGRGTIDRYFAILTDSGSARLRVDGVTTAPVRLFCGEPCT